MKHVHFLAALFVVLIQPGLAEEPDLKVVPAEVSTSPKLPKYMLYRHLLGWANSLNETAVTNRIVDTNKFNEIFAKQAGLLDPNVDYLRQQAKSLTRHIHDVDATASILVTTYRAKALLAAKQGQSLPAIPKEIKELQQARTCMLIHYFVAMREKLGKDESAKLENYLVSEFAPHLKDRILQQPENNRRQAQSFSHEEK